MKSIFANTVIKFLFVLLWNSFLFETYFLSLSADLFSGLCFNFVEAVRVFRFAVIFVCVLHTSGRLQRRKHSGNLLDRASGYKF